VAIATGLILSLAHVPASALDADRTLAQLHHTAWAAEDGAPSQISALVQTTDGYLWIGSARGLFRFDGVEFERYVPPDSVSLPSHNTYHLLPTSDGGMWISFRPSGLGFVKDRRLTTFVHPEEIPPSQVYVLASDLDGRVWAGTHAGLFLREGSRWMSIGSDWNLPPFRVQTLFVDRDGTLWVSGGERFHALARGSKSFVLRGDPIGWTSEIIQAPDGRVWVMEDGRVRPMTIAGQGDSMQAPTIRMTPNDIIVDRDGCLWLAARTDGLRRVQFPKQLDSGDIAPDDRRLESMREADGLSADEVHVLLEDREGNVWAGTSKGLDRFRHSHFVPLTLPAGHQALTLLPGEKGEVWAASATGKPLLRIRNQEIEEFDMERRVASVHRTPDGVVWWGANEGVTRQHDGAFTHYPHMAGIGDELIWEIFRSDGAGAFWMFVDEVGLVHFENGTWEKRPTPVGLPNWGPSASYHAPDGRIWLGYRENRAYLLSGSEVRSFTHSDGIEIGRIRAIRGRGPHFWFGGELGLALFHEGRFRTVACEGSEPFGTVSGIVETSDGSLWLNEMRGVVNIPADEIQLVLRDPSHAVSFRRFDVREGLPGAGQMNWTNSTAIGATDGRLWFATDGGLAWIHPQRITTNTLPPPVAIRSVGTEAGTYDASTDIRLRNGTATLRIDYTALSLAIPELVRFRYRLEGYDEDWRDAGTRRSAFYTHVRPGSYRFQVVASNNDGVWNTTGASVLFSIAPAFYQTTWFAACCLLAALGALWLFYLLRVRQVATRLQRLHDERVDERMRIAHELHDTLLQGFLSASMQLHVARDTIPADSPAKNQVGRVLGLMDEVIGDARNTVRGLRTQSDSASTEIEHAFTRIQQELTGNGSVDFRVVVNGRPRPLQPVARDEVYRIGRESLMNAFRHAGASTIETELYYLPRELRVVVRDDGCGIDPDVLRTGRDGHFGLSGMRERAKRMDAQLAVRSRVGSGTEVELVVPGRVAFSGEPAPNGFRRVIRRLRERSAREVGEG